MLDGLPSDNSQDKVVHKKALQQVLFPVLFFSCHAINDLLALVLTFSPLAKRTSLPERVPSSRLPLLLGGGVGKARRANRVEGLAPYTFPPVSGPRQGCTGTPATWRRRGPGGKAAWAVR